MSDDAQRRPYGKGGGSFDPAAVLEPSMALVPATIHVNEVKVRNGFWPKMRKVAARVPFAKQALSAYFVARDPETPWRTKGLVYGALAYFVLPTDAIPDIIAGLGYTDDAAVLMTLITVLGGAIKPRHQAQADAALEKLKAAD